MVTFEKNDKKLVIPSALGNFGVAGGSTGSGITPEQAAEISSAITEAAINEYDIEIQVDLEEIRENVSAATEGLATLSGITAGLSGATEAAGQAAATNAENISTLSGTTDTIIRDMVLISAATDNLAEAVETLTDGLSAYTTNDTYTQGIQGVQGQISGLSGQVTELSAATETIGTGLGTLSGATEAIEQAMSGKQDAISAGNGIDISGATISVKAGEGLGFSGDTLVVSGNSGGGQVFYIDDVYGTYQDLATLLFSYWDSINGVMSSAYTADDIHIYMWMGQNFQGAFESDFKGYIEVFPDSVWEEEGIYTMNLTAVFSHSTTAYAFKYGITQAGESRGNWLEPVFNFSFNQYITYVRFGNDGRGYLTYDADNDRFEYDSGYVATGDTSNACEDLVDWLLTKEGIVDGKLVFDYICVQNLNKFFVTSNGETKTYTHPTIGFKELSSPYTIGDYEFGYEITYGYTDWILKIDISEGHNVGANVRITAV